jgi:hypothetical protein
MLATCWWHLAFYIDEEEDKASEDREGWETIVMDGQIYGVRTSAMDEKPQAFETSVIYCSTLGPRFAPYLAQTLHIKGRYLNQIIREW